VAAQFNAGSIESQLDLNRDPFTEGLRLAKQQAREFADERIVATADVDTGDAAVKLTELNEHLDELDGRQADVTVDVDALAALGELDEVEAKVDDLDGRTINIDTKTSRDNLNSLGGAADRASGRDSGGRGGLGGLVGIIAALSPLVGPLAGMALGLGGAFGVAGAGLGAFGIVAAKDFSEMHDSIKAVTKAQEALNSATTPEGASRPR